MVTFPHDARNLVYYASDGSGEKKRPKGGERPPGEKLDGMLQILARHVTKDRAPAAGDLERIIESALRQEGAQDAGGDADDAAPHTKLLREAGYLRDGQNWLTGRAFHKIGHIILRDIMSNLEQGEYGLHETDNTGSGSTITDNTKMLEPGDDTTHLSATHTLLNAVRRAAREGRTVPPISLTRDDLEAYETIRDVRASVVYCIDLSSTMRIKLADGTSRIEAAKRALWGLYALNKKLFPGDGMFVVGFASLASRVGPADIPFLRTFDANDGFLHYTNYQAALRLAGRILKKDGAKNRRIVLVTDGQPSACFVEGQSQKNDVMSAKPYSSLYSPDHAMMSAIREQRGLGLDADPGRLVYLCYMHKKIDRIIRGRTLAEARRRIREGVSIDSIIVGEEAELFEYAEGLERELGGRAYNIGRQGMEGAIMRDYISSRKVFSKKRHT